MHRGHHFGTSLERDIDDIAPDEPRAAGQPQSHRSLAVVGVSLHLVNLLGELLGDVGKALVTLGGSRRQRCEQCTARRPSLERSNRSQKWSAGPITVKRFHRLALQDFAITVDTHFGNDLA